MPSFILVRAVLAVDAPSRGRFAFWPIPRSVSIARTLLNTRIAAQRPTRTAPRSTARCRRSDPDTSAACRPCRAPTWTSGRWY